MNTTPIPHPNVLACSLVSLPWKCPLSLGQGSQRGLGTPVTSQGPSHGQPPSSVTPGLAPGDRMVARPPGLWPRRPAGRACWERREQTCIKELPSPSPDSPEVGAPASALLPRADLPSLPAPPPRTQLLPRTQALPAGRCPPSVALSQVPQPSRTGGRACPVPHASSTLGSAPHPTDPAKQGCLGEAL